ncbi:anthrone oxygenase family protein [Thalassococcus sp. BH17M4-6]|uniref:anthrone oxygenase family protein n=1 Tax=Thalassococcus sp. BH17M4-6 TaxID=3413148 RepID=UPI003BF61808
MDAIRAMQELNRGTRNGVFLFTFLFTPILALGCAAVLYFKGRQTSALFLFAAAAIYFGGSFLPTVNVSVPMNHAIEAIDPAGISLAEAAQIWADYSADWTYWNTIRAVMALIGLALAATAMYSVTRVAVPVGQPA